MSPTWLVAVRRVLTMAMMSVVTGRSTGHDSLDRALAPCLMTLCVWQLHLIEVKDDTGRLDVACVGTFTHPKVWLARVSLPKLSLTMAVVCRRYGTLRPHLPIRFSFIPATTQVILTTLMAANG